MKRTFKFFMAAIVAAGMMASCSSEEVTPTLNNQNPEAEGTETYATFKLGSGTDTRATLVGSASESDDSKLTTAGGITLLLYKSASRILEKKIDMTANAETFLVTAGKKKIFVVANYKSITATATAINGFTEGTSTMDELLALNFDAQEANKASFSYVPLHTLVTGGGLPASNDNGTEYDLKPDIDSNTASGGAPVTGGESPTNTFDIQLYFMLAKANLYLGASVLNAGSATEPAVSNIKYTIWNLARHTNIIRNGTGKAVQSYYFAFPFNATSVQTDFDPYFDYTTAIDKDATTTKPTLYYYITENNHNYLVRGQSTHFAIEALYKPNAVVHTVKYDVGSGTLKTESKPLKDFAAPVDNEKLLDYVYTLKAIGGIPAGSYFKHFKLLQIAAWINTYRGEWTGSAEQTLEAEALVTSTEVGTAFYQFENALSYYRLDIGEDATGNSLEPGVLRGNRYEVMINSIGGPGVPSADNIIDRPWDPVVANTYIHATITPAVWSPIVQLGNLN